MIKGLNHLTLATGNLERGVAFYRDVLGLELAKQWDGGAYLSAGSLWLCLSPDKGTAPSSDYTHFALDVDEKDFAPMKDRILAADADLWKTNGSEGASLYFCDPDGHQLELHVGTLETRLAAMNLEPAQC
ncbi:glutathione transferase [Sulfitobacter sp. SK012]|uniref:VOC family protein n=1 Tax=Sulfitobacter sp. SK012 TaxID=1389005 RepID=UPI000E0AFE5C|nr:VOC family protein [Sulfitobacter sp. SK012]AXI47294.1 glutathione transferase [Sulfitobacter sp. SK012]